MSCPPVSRRTALHLLAGVTGAACAPRHLHARAIPTTAQGFALRATDDALLDAIERRACRYFVEQASATTGQVLDRAAANNTDGKRDPRRMASIAATGFGLTALAIADQRGYLTRDAAYAQVLRTLRFHANVLPHEHGFFCHFDDVDTGAPWPQVEFSSIDTALLLCGVLTARVHFGADPEVVRLATTIYERVDWPWMLNGEATFSMGWKPQTGFLAARWNHYCELMMIPLLALGSPTHPVGPEVWTAWSRPKVAFDGFTYISGNDPLFTHQYSHAWFDFRGRHDAYADYFENSVLATRAHRDFCLGLGAPYAKNYWGISASDSAAGYQAWGGPPAQGRIDGSVVPYATAGSLPFLPEACLAVQHFIKERYGARAWGRYGFCDALHPQADWYDPDVLGIDLGISLVMAENLRSGFVWSTFAKNPEVAVAMAKAGLVARA